MAPDNRQVGIFRLQLFKPSETFITSQADGFERYSPVFVGRTLFGDSNGRRVVTAALRPGLMGKIDTASLVLTRNPQPFVRSLDRSVDLLHAHFGIDAVYAAPLAKRLKKPLVTTLHGFDVTRSDADLLRSGRPALINGVLHRKALQKQGDLFICVSEFIRRAAIEKGYPEDKLRVHYIGIDTTKLQPREGPGEEGLILHVARLVEKKGTRYLLDAFARIAPAHPKARLVIIGDGPLRADLERQARELGIADRCQFVGGLPNAEVLSWDARAAIKAVPSITASDGDREGLPTVITETNAQAVPVVAFDSGGIAEAVIHGETGLLSAERDVQGLADNLALLLGNADLRLRLGRSARMQAEALFDVKKQTAKLEIFYDEIIENHQG